MVFITKYIFSLFPHGREEHGARLPGAALGPVSTQRSKVMMRHHGRSWGPTCMFVLDKRLKFISGTVTN